MSAGGAYASFKQTPLTLASAGSALGELSAGNADVLVRLRVISPTAEQTVLLLWRW